MANRYLLPVYQKLYGEVFDYSDFDKRMKMQKAVYLLQDLGVPVGDYGFRWYLHGPYSQQLQDDMHDAKGRNTKPAFCREYEEQIDRLGQAIHSEDRGQYSVSSWMECMASLHYLRENELPYDASDKEILEALAQKKPHLNDTAANTAAIRHLEELFA